MEKTIGLVMAAGKDDKMVSKKSKLAQNIYGKEVIKRVVETLKRAGLQEIYVIVGENQEEIKSILKEEVQYIYQENSIGTADAVKQAEAILKGKQGRVLIMNGNVPLLTSNTVQQLIKRAKESDTSVTLLSGILQDPTGYGRVCRKDNEIEKIVEEVECDEKEKDIPEINSGVYCFKISDLLANISQIKPDEKGQENLTKIISILYKNGCKTEAMPVEDVSEILSLNTKLELEMLSRILRIRINTMHMNRGVTIEDISNTYIYEDVEIGIDTVIHPNTTIKSGVIIGEDCEIGPNAYIREGCKLSNKVKVGSFVEIKKAIIEEGSKVPHLSYMGDCEIGKKCNIGCGTITCNYDGFNKSKTKIGDYGFIGSNTNLIAPVTLGDNVFVAAGSTITDDVPSDSLAIARQRQTNKENWNKKAD